jgi:hypothetical protein
VKTKGKWFLLSGLVALLVVPLQACYIGRTPPSLTEVQAVVIIQVYAVPYIDQYYAETLGKESPQPYTDIGYITPTGEWDAKYKGEGNWRIEGTVKTNNLGNCSTIWTFNEGTGEVRLIEFECGQAG